MDATELDLPLLPSADQIRRREFATVRRGYDPDQVRDYLYTVGHAVEALEHQLREAKLELEAALRTQQESRRDPYQEISTRMADLLRSADQQAESILLEAKEEYRRMIEEARAEADRIRLDAQSRAEEARQEGHDVLDRAREEADRMLTGLAERRRSLVEQLQGMQERLIDVAKELEVVIEPARADELEAAGDRAAAQAAAEETAPSADHPVDPRYEDLWAGEATVDLTGLEVPALDLELEDEDQQEEERT